MIPILPDPPLPHWNRRDTRRVALLFVLAAGLHAALWAFEFLHLRQGWDIFLGQSDGGSYLTLAKVVWRRFPAAALTFYDSRVFPGWPLAYGWLLRFLPASAAVLGSTLFCAGAVPALFYLLTRSWPAALSLLWLPPAWLLATVHPIAEGFFLGCGLAGWWCWRRGRPGCAGLALGLMCAAKPYGLFLAAPLAAAVARRDGKWQPAAAARYLVGGGAMLVLLVAFNLRLYGDPLRQFHVYAAPLSSLNLGDVGSPALRGASGHWGWPLKYLLLTPWQTPVPAWKIAYVYGCALAAAFLLLRPLRRLRLGATATELLLLAWLAGNTLAVCCTGPYWGFESFDRYDIWAWPAALALNADLCEDHPRLHALAAAASVLLCFATLVRHHG